MSGIPVNIVDKDGLPVRAVERGAPLMTVAPPGRGIPITLTERGTPFVVQGGAPPVDFDWQPFSMTAGGEGQWVGYSTGQPTTPQPAFGSIGSQPTDETTLIAFYDDTASGVFLAVFSGNYVNDMEGLQLSIGGFVVDSFEVELISGNTWVRFFGIPGDLMPGAQYEVEFGTDLAPQQYDPNALALFSALSVQPSDAVKARINDEFLGLKSSGLWPLIDMMQVSLNHPQSMTVNWKNAAISGGPVNNPPFVPFQGYTTDGVSTYFNTGYVPADGPIFQGANAHLAFRELATGNTDARNIGTGPSLAFISRTASNNRFWMRLNSSVQIDITGASPTSPSVYLGTRSAGTQMGYRNGTSVGSGAASTPPVFDAAPIWIGRVAPTGFRVTQIPAWTAGAFLTAAQAQTLTNRINSLTNDLAAIGA